MVPPWPLKILPYAFAALVAARILGWRIDRRICIGLTVAGAVLLFWLDTIVMQNPVDAGHFWDAGVVIRQGESPYFGPILNPPTSFPLFILASLVPKIVFLKVWCLLSAVGLLALVPTAVWALRDEDGPRPDWVPDWPTLGLLSACVSVSSAASYQQYLGQSSFLASLLLFAALALADRDRPGPAGLALAFASLKVGTLIVFLSLFLRKRDWKTWAVMAAAGLLFAVTTTAPMKIPARMKENLARIKLFSQEGQINDVGLNETESAGLLTLGKVIHSFGVRNRAWVSAGEMAASAALLAGLVWFLRKSGWGRPAQASLVACVSLLFLYHRIYDAVFLALPLTYAFGRAQEAGASSRAWYRGAALACLGALFTPKLFLLRMMAFARTESTTARLVEIVTVPLAVWFVIAAAVLLVGAEHRAAREAIGPDLANLEPLRHDRGA